MFIKILNQFFKGKIKTFREILDISVIRYCFLVPLILTKLDINTNQMNIDNDLYSLAVSYFILSLGALFAFTNVVGYLSVIVLRYKYDLDSKFPKFKKIFTYFEKSSLIVIIIEAIFCILILLFFILVNLAIIIAYRS